MNELLQLDDDDCKHVDWHDDGDDNGDDDGDNDESLCCILSLLWLSWVKQVYTELSD